MPETPFNKVAGHLRPATLSKTSLSHRCFPINFFEISKNAFFYRTPLAAASEGIYVKESLHFLHHPLSFKTKDVYFLKLLGEISKASTVK